MLSLKPLIRTSPELGVFVQAASLLPAQGGNEDSGGEGGACRLDTRLYYPCQNDGVCMCFCFVFWASRHIEFPTVTPPLQTQKKKKPNTQAATGGYPHTVKGSDIQCKWWNSSTHHFTHLSIQFWLFPSSLMCLSSMLRSKRKAVGSGDWSTGCCLNHTGGVC